MADIAIEDAAGLAFTGADFFPAGRPSPPKAWARIPTKGKKSGKMVMKRVANWCEREGATATEAVDELESQLYEIFPRKKQRSLLYHSSTQDDLMLDPGNNIFSLLSADQSHSYVESIGKSLMLEATTACRNASFGLPSPTGLTVNEMVQKYRNHTLPPAPLIPCKRTYTGEKKQSSPRNVRLYELLKPLLDIQIPVLSLEAAAEAQDQHLRKQVKQRHIRLPISRLGAPNVSIVEEQQEPLSPTPKLAPGKSKSKFVLDRTRMRKIGEGWKAVVDKFGRRIRPQHGNAAVTPASTPLVTSTTQAAIEPSMHSASHAVDFAPSTPAAQTPRSSLHADPDQSPSAAAMHTPGFTFRCPSLILSTPTTSYSDNRGSGFNDSHVFSSPVKSPLTEAVLQSPTASRRSNPLPAPRYNSPVTPSVNSVVTFENRTPEDVILSQPEAKRRQSLRSARHLSNAPLRHIAAENSRRHSFAPVALVPSSPLFPSSLSEAKRRTTFGDFALDASVDGSNQLTAQSEALFVADPGTPQHTSPFIVNAAVTTEPTTPQNMSPFIVKAAVTTESAAPQNMSSFIVEDATTTESAAPQNTSSFMVEDAIATESAAPQNTSPVMTETAGSPITSPSVTNDVYQSSAASLDVPMVDDASHFNGHLEMADDASQLGASPKLVDDASRLSASPKSVDGAFHLNAASSMFDDTSILTGSPVRQAYSDPTRIEQTSVSKLEASVYTTGTMLDVDVRDNPDIFGASVEKLAEVARELDSMHAKVVITREAERLIVRFKLPERYAESFPPTQHHQSVPVSQLSVAATQTTPRSTAADNFTQASTSLIADSEQVSGGDILTDDASQVTPPTIISQQSSEVPLTAVADTQQDDDDEWLRSYVKNHRDAKAARQDADPARSSATTLPEPVRSSSGTLLPDGTPKKTVMIEPTKLPMSKPPDSSNVPFKLEASRLPSYPRRSGSLGSTATGSPIAAQSAIAKRQPLGSLDVNSPSPKKAKRKLGEDFVPLTNTAPQDSPQPVRKRRRRADDMLLDDVSSMVGSGLPPVKNQEPVHNTRNRGLRSLRPTAPSANSSATSALRYYPNSISDNTADFITTRNARNEEKDLATLTRANTRKNKGHAVFPQEVLARHAEDPAGSRLQELKSVFEARQTSASDQRPRKNVRFSARLARYQGDEEDDEETKKVKVDEEPEKPETAPKRAPASKLKQPTAGRKKTTVDATTGPNTEGAKVTKPAPMLRKRVNAGLSGNGTPAPKRRTGRVVPK